MSVTKNLYAQRIDEFWGARKQLINSELPEWERDQDGIEYRVRLPLEVNLQVPGHAVEVTSYAPNPPEFKINLFYESSVISRLDYRETARHVNSFSQNLSIPINIVGPHYHAWPENRDFVDPRAHWSLRFAKPLEPNIRQFQAAFRWFCDQNNIDQPERVFDLPPVERLL